jgi:hypothetical protein
LRRREAEQHRLSEMNSLINRAFIHEVALGLATWITRSRITPPHAFASNRLVDALDLSSPFTSLSDAVSAVRLRVPR